MRKRNPTITILAITLILFLIPTMNTSISNEFFTTPVKMNNNVQISGNMGATISWTYSTVNLIDSDPVAVDLDADGTLEVLVGCENNILYCFDHEGFVEWSYTTDECVLGSPAVADIDKDGDLEILVGTRGSTLYCFDSEGEIEWTFPTIGWAWSTVCLADIDLDGNLEILFTTKGNMLYCLNSTGSEFWHVDTGNDAEVPPAVGDFDEDGFPDIVVGNHNGRVYCYNSTGHELWNSYAGGGIMNSAFCISDLDGDGHLEIVIGSWDQTVYCFYHNGTLRWSFATGGTIDMSTASCVDLDNDGALEVLIGSNDNRLHCFDHDGNEEWYYQTSGNVRSSPMVADLDGDNNLDILIPSQDDYLYCLNRTGDFNWSVDLGAAPWEDPCIADLDGDGVLEIIVSGYDNLHCITLTGVTKSGAAPWSCYLGSTHHTGWIDRDSDSLDDFSETTYYHTYIDDADSDSDSYNDGTEVFAGTDPLNPDDFPVGEAWALNDYLAAIDELYNTFNYFNLSKYGGGWQYEVTRDWTDIAFTNGKFIFQDAECITGLIAAYNLTSDTKYLKYAEDIWNWDHTAFYDDVYGGYYVRLNQDNSIAIGDKGMYEHGWYGLATARLYIATGNMTYLNEISDIYGFVTDNFYNVGDGSYYGALNRDLSIQVSDVDTNWVAPYARFLMTVYSATGNLTYHDKAIELIDNLIDYAYDPLYGWIVNRVTSDWSSFSNSAKGWYDVLQTFIDAYRVFGDPTYLTFAQTCYNDIQQANSTVGYLMEMNRDWTSVVNNQLLGEEDPGTAIAYLRIATALDDTEILQEAYRYRDAIYTGLHDPTYGGIYRVIYSTGSQGTWKQWCGAGRVMEMLAEFAIAKYTVGDTTSPVWSAEPVDQQLELNEFLNYQLYATDMYGIAGWSVNDTVHFHISSSGLVTNATFLEVGVYGLNISVWDTSGNTLWKVIDITVVDTIPPEWIIEPANLVYEVNESISYQLYADDLSGLGGWMINDTLHFHISESGLITNITTLEAESFFLNITVFDIYDNILCKVIEIDIFDTIPPSWIEDPHDYQIEQSDGLSYQLYATDFSGLSGWGINDTVNFHISGTGLLTNATVLEIGVYGLNISVWDTSGNLLWTIIEINVIADVPTTTTTTTSIITTTTTTTNVSENTIIWDILLFSSLGISIIALIVIILELKNRRV